MYCEHVLNRNTRTDSTDATVDYAFTGLRCPVTNRPLIRALSTVWVINNAHLAQFL